jgi:hypothetical protein
VDDERLSNEINHKLPGELFCRMADWSAEPLSRQGNPNWPEKIASVRPSSSHLRGGNGSASAVRPAIERGPLQLSPIATTMTDDLDGSRIGAVKKNETDHVTYLCERTPARNVGPATHSLKSPQELSWIYRSRTLNVRIGHGTRGGTKGYS